MNIKLLRSSLCVAGLVSANLAWAQRAVNIVVTGGQITGTGSAKIVLTAQGDENAVSYTFNFDPAVLQYSSTSRGSGVPADATFLPNASNAASGRVTYLIGLAPDTVLPAGSQELAVINFTALANSASTGLTFSSSPTVSKVSDKFGNSLTTSFNNATIAANLPPSAPTITTHPTSQTANPGSTVNFTVAASGNPAPTYQWRKDGTDLSGRTGATLTLTNVGGSDIGSYTAVASNGVGSPAVSNAATLSLNPGIGSFSPASGSIGTSVVIVGAGFTGATAVQFNGVAAASFTINSNYQITAVVPTFASNGPISVTPATGSPLVSATIFTLTPGPRLINMSHRANSTAGENAVMQTFSIRGTGKQQVLVRVAGPALATFGVTGTMADPFLSVYDGTGTQIASNNDWDSSLAPVFSAVGAFTFATGSKDAALLLNLDPGTYTARVTGVGGTTGVVLLEAYEYSPSGTSDRLEYLASRVAVSGTPEATGFVVGGAGASGSTSVLIRAVGSGLGVTGALANPTLTVYSGATAVATNDNHTSTNVSQADLAAATAAVGAMPLAANDSALLLTLPAGAYTAQVSGVGGTSGVVLTEVFVVDSFLPTAFAPDLVAPLHPKAANLGETVVFAAPFIAKPAPTFQWQKAGADISGKTTSVLTLTNVTSADTAAYRVILQNGSGTNTTAAAQLDVNKAAQTITFPAISAKTYGTDTSVTLNATSSSGLPVSYTLSNASPGTVATLTGNVVTIVNAGTITITASQPGNADFLPAADIPQTLTVNKGTATIVLSGLAATYDGSPKAVTVTTAPSGLSASITYTPSGGTATTTAPTNAGTYAVNATVSDMNYQGTQTGNLVIAKADQTITFGALANKTFGDAAFTVSASATSGLTPAFSIASGPASISGNTVTITGAGSVTVRAAQPGDNNYNAAPNVDQTFTVAKADQTITFGALTGKTYGDAPFTVSATASSSLAPTFSVVSGPATISGNTVTITGAGSVTIRASQVGNANFNAAADVDQSFTIAKANQTISFAPPKTSYALDESPVALNGASSSGLALTYTSSDPTVVSVSGSTLTLLKVGTTTITASQPGDANYIAAAPVAVNLQVTSQSQTISFDQTQLPTKTYGNANFTITATSNRGLLVGFVSDNTAVATVSASTLVGGASNSTVTIVGAGTAHITASQPGDGNTAAAPDVTRTLTVNKAAATITLAGLTQTYDGSPKAVTSTTNPTGLNVVITYTPSGGTASATPPTDAGSYAVNAAISGSTPPESNYTGSATGTLVIAKSDQTIAFTLGSPVLITSAPITLGGAATSNLTVNYASSNASVATVSGNTLTVKGLGTTTITASQAGNANYNAAPNVTQAFTVNPIAPVIASTPPLNQMAIVGSNFVFGPITIASQLAAPYTFSATGLPAGVTVNTANGNISGIPTSAPNDYTIILTVTNATGSDSRQINLTLRPPVPAFTSAAAVSGTAGASFTYTAVATNLPSYSLTGTLPAGLTFNGSTGVMSGTPTAAGTTTVNITATNVSGSVTLPLVISIAWPANAPVYAGGLNPSGTAGTAFSFTPSFSGTVASYAITGTLPTGLTFNNSTGAITGTTTQVGSFPVVLSATGAGVTVPVNLTVTINPANSAPVITSASSRVTGAGASYTFDITASHAPTSFAATDAGGTISFATSGLTLNTVTNNGTMVGRLSGTVSKTPGTVRLSVTAANAAGTSAPAPFILTIEPSGTAPVITSAVVVAGQVGVPMTYNLTSTAGVGGAVLTVGNVTYGVTGTLPGGLTLNGAAGTVTGTPAAPGTYENIYFVGTDNNGFSGLGLEIIFNIAPAASVPVVDSNGTASGQVGQFFNYTITATNSPTSFAATPLPAGLSLNAATGVISGVPSVASPTVPGPLGGTIPVPTNVTLSASNSAGISAPKTLRITITPAPGTPVISSAAAAAGRVGTAFNYAITASDSPTSFVVTGLPVGLSVNPTTGVISGTPTVAGSSTARLSAANAAGLGAESPLVLTIASALTAPVISSAGAVTGQVGTAFSYQIVAAPTPITSYAIASGTLPAGLSLNSVTGAISGNPATPGVTTVSLTATGDGGTSLPQPLMITINAAAGVPVITSSGTATGTVGSSFAYSITATNSPTTFDAVNLPAGLAVNTSTGVIQGQPTAVGTTTAGLVATNINGTGPIRDLLITVQPPTAAPVVTSANSAAGQVGQGFSYQITATNAPTAFEVLGAPPWMTINSATGALAGTPTVPGSLTVQLVASNAAGASSPRPVTINIAGAAGTPAITSPRLASGTVGIAFTYAIGASPAATGFTVTGLPSGLTLNPSGSPAGTIGGTPTQSGTFNVTISGFNGVGAGTPVTVVVTIAPSAVLVVP